MKQPTRKFDCIYTNGCSWTYGSELIDPDLPTVIDHFDDRHNQYRINHQWPTHLAQSWGVPVYDGSEAGGCNDRIVRTTFKDVNELLMQGRRPFVVIAWTQLHRFELPHGGAGEHYRQFVSPNDSDLPRAAKEIWAQWSGDRSDVVRWLVNLISVDAFLKAVGVDYIGTTVFNKTYRTYEAVTEDNNLSPYTEYLKTQMALSRHLLHYSLEGYLRQQAHVEYGPGGHPLMHGHQLISEHIRRHMLNTFHFQR